jgi:hypothetical protein
MHSWSGWRRWTATFAILLLGCGPGYRTAPVSGRITLDGAPLDGASVTFTPIPNEESSGQFGMGSYGKTDGEGRYSLKLIETDTQGAAVGEHRVQVSLPENSGSDSSAGQASDRVPARYRGLESELTITVPEEGTTEANFDLQSQPGS